MRCCTTNGKPAIAKRSAASNRRTLLLSPVVPSPTDMTTGQCVCSPAKWSSWASWRRSHPRPSGRGSKNELKPWRYRQWCIPAMSGKFVAAMEDILALYQQPYDAHYPTVCLDEKPVELHADVRTGLPLAPSQVERRNYEHERHGTANLFVMVEPLAGWRRMAVTSPFGPGALTRCRAHL